MPPTDTRNRKFRPAAQREVGGRAHVHGCCDARLLVNWCFFIIYAIFGARELLLRSKSSRAPKCVPSDAGEQGFCSPPTKKPVYVNGRLTHPTLTCTNYARTRLHNAREDVVIPHIVRSLRVRMESHAVLYNSIEL